MVDINAAVNYVTQNGDSIDHARLEWIRSGSEPPEGVFDTVESGQVVKGGWPALCHSRVPSIDATCFHLAELDDLGGLGRPAACKALSWIASRQDADGFWEEDPSLASVAPPWARPGDGDARLFLTVRVGFWLAVSQPRLGGACTLHNSETKGRYDDAVINVVHIFKKALNKDGSWPSYLMTAWYGGALLYYLGSYYESAQIQVMLSERVPELSSADTASLSSTMRRVGISADDLLLTAARTRLGKTQRPDGGWSSGNGSAFDVHTTLTVLRAFS